MYITRRQYSIERMPDAFGGMLVMIWLFVLLTTAYHPLPISSQDIGQEFSTYCYRSTQPFGWHTKFSITYLSIIVWKVNTIKEEYLPTMHVQQELKCTSQCMPRLRIWLNISTGTCNIVDLQWMYRVAASLSWMIHDVCQVITWTKSDHLLVKNLTARSLVTLNWGNSTFIEGLQYVWVSSSKQVNSFGY